MHFHCQNEAQLPDDAGLGEELLIRVRVVTLREETIEVTAFGDTEPQVIRGDREAEVIWLATRRA